MAARIPSPTSILPVHFTPHTHTRCILICLLPQLYHWRVHNTSTHSLPPYHFTEEPSSPRSNRSRAIICLPPTIRRSNLTAGRHLGGGGLGPNKGKHLPRSFTVCSDASPLLWEICVCCTQIPLFLGGNWCVRGYFGPAVHCTALVLVHTQGSFVSKILTPHASPVGFYRLCQGFFTTMDL